MHRVVTVAREYGAGGAIMGGMVAERLGWKLLDRALLETIARRARVDPKAAARFDECVDPWLHRIAKQALWRGYIEAVANVAEGDIFDSEAMARFATDAIREAAEIGGCVIVGRGAQCILQGRPDTFHVFVYGPFEEKLRRVRGRFPEVRDPAAMMAEMDRRRENFIRRYFRQNWCDRQLYDLLVNSRCGLEEAARSVVCAAGLTPAHS
jgi:cytidylate kinase